MEKCMYFYCVSLNKDQSHLHYLNLFNMVCVFTIVQLRYESQFRLHRLSTRLKNVNLAVFSVGRAVWQYYFACYILTNLR